MENMNAHNFLRPHIRNFLSSEDLLSAEISSKPIALCQVRSRFQCEALSVTETQLRAKHGYSAWLFQVFLSWAFCLESLPAVFTPFSWVFDTLIITTTS